MLSTSPSPARSISHPVNLAKQGNRGTESSSGSSPAPPSKWGLLAMPAQHHLRGEPSPAAGTQDSPPTPSGKSGQYLTRNPSSSQADFQANGQLRERAAEPGRAQSRRRLLCLPTYPPGSPGSAHTPGPSCFLHVQHITPVWPGAATAMWGPGPWASPRPCFPQVASVTWLLKPTGPQVGPQFLPLLPLPQGLSTPCRLYGNPRPSLQLRPPHSSGGGSFSRSRSVRRGPGLPSSAPAQPEPCVYLQVTLVHLLDWEGACVPPWAQHSSSVSPAGGRMGNPDSDPLQGCRCEMLKEEHRNGCVDADADGDEE